MTSAKRWSSLTLSPSKGDQAPAGRQQRNLRSNLPLAPSQQWGRGEGDRGGEGARHPQNRDTISAMTNSNPQPQSIDVLAATPETLRAMLTPIPADAIEASGDEGWSPRDVIAHLQSTEGVAFHDRIETIAAGGHPTIANYDEELELDRSGLRERAIGELLDGFSQLRAESVRYLRSLPADVFAHTGAHSVAGEISLADLVNHRAYHDELHIAQIASLLAAGLHPYRGNLQRF